MRNLTIAIVVLGILAGIVFLTADLGRRESKYRSVFLSVPDIEEVGYFLYYEEHTSAGLYLTDGRYLGIAEFDDTVGTSTSHIGLAQIGDLTVFCSTTRERRDVVAGGFNILEVMRSSPLQLELRNIGDVVAHYGEIYKYLEESLPTEIAEPKQLNIRPYFYWCSRGWSTKRARN